LATGITRASDHQSCYMHEQMQIHHVITVLTTMNTVPEDRVPYILSAR